MASLIWLLQDSYCTPRNGRNGISDQRWWGRRAKGKKKEGTDQGTEVVPDLGDVRVQADGARVGIERVTILVDLVIEDADGAPKGGVAAIPIDGLLIGFVGLGILLLRHVTTTEEVPTLRVALI